MTDGRGATGTRPIPPNANGIGFAPDSIRDTLLKAP
jgi:hypothetical protein